MSEIVKVCKVHGELKESECLKRIEKRSREPKLYYICRVCNKEKQKKYRTKPGMKERLREKSKIDKVRFKEGIYKARKKWKEANKEKLREQQNAWRAKNLEFARELVRNKQKKWRDELHDNYIKNNLGRALGLKAGEIPKELLDLNRTVIMLKREIKEKTK